jgi:uncharacterized protein YkwD
MLQTASFLMRWRPALRAGAALTALSVLGAACTGVLGDPDDPGVASGAGGDDTSGASSNNQGSSGNPSGSSGATTQGAGGSSGGTGGAGPSSSSAGNGSTSASSSSGAGGASPADLICQRWKSDRADLGEGAWSGDVASCNPGDVSADGRANALKLVNLYRFMVGLPAVTTDPTRDQKAQSCALMMDANNMLNHSPPMNWACYSQDGAQGAGNSNISPTPGVEGVDLYMTDPGNQTTMGHRRWILSGSLGPIGLGSTSSHSCMWVIGGSGGSNPAFTAWPPPGPFPAEAFNVSFQTLDQTGWTIQSSVIDLNGAQVAVTDGGQDRPMAVTQLQNGYGSTWAIRMVPNGWTSQIGHTYSVVVSGLSQAISYDVEVVSCN